MPEFPVELSIRCRCGKLGGRALIGSAGDMNRALCYCADCQLFAHFAADADGILDAHGGTDILQMSAACLHIERGAEHLACLRLTPSGLFRWYADCCRTPIGNTLPSAVLPFIGVVHRAIAEAEDPAAYDAAVGPCAARVYGKYAVGDRSTLNAHDTAPLGLVARMALRMLRWRLAGAHRRHPLFDPDTGKPNVTPTVLAPEELEELREAAGRWPVSGSVSDERDRASGTAD